MASPSLFHTGTAEGDSTGPRTLMDCGREVPRAAGHHLRGRVPKVRRSSEGCRVAVFVDKTK